MSTQIASVPGRVSAWVEGWLRREKRTGPAKIEPLAGDGSLRCYFRLRLPNRTYVLLSDAGWISSKDYAPHQAYLTERGIPVPTFLVVDAAEGFGVMDDLGDELLQDRLKKVDANAAEKHRWLQSAAVLLAELHVKTFPVPATLPVATRRFDTQKYYEELQFTLEHLHAKFLGRPAPDAARLATVRAFCETLDGMRPDVFSHRDYHTRNLLVHGEKLYMIDFQDARLGSVQYDLASLLYDAYVPIAAAEKTALVGAYRDAVAGTPLGRQIAWDRFDDDLRRVAFQRTVKAAGSFASFFTRWGKRTHLPYLVPALESALALQRACFGAGDAIHAALPVAEWLAEAKGRVP